MTEILSELQAGYEERARIAAEPPVVTAAVKVRRKATRTYTGAALERRRAWAALQKERYGRIMEQVNAEFGG